MISREVPGHRELTDPTVYWHIRYFLRNSKRFLHVACSEADKRVDEIVEAFSDSLKEEPSYIGLAALYQLLMIAVRNIERVNAETKGFNSGDKQFLRDMGIAP